MKYEHPEEFYRDTASEIGREYAQVAREQAAHSKNGSGKKAAGKHAYQHADKAKPTPKPKPEAPTAISFSGPDLKRHTFAYHRPILLRGGTPILCEGHIAEVYGLRGIGKTWFTMTLAMVASSGQSAIGFSAKEPLKVLLIDGEMAGPDLQERFVNLEERLGLALTKNLTIVAADWQTKFLPRLDTRAGQAFIEPYVAEADFIILDNRSTLFDPESEKDPTAWQPAQNWVLSLRRRRKAVLIVHHTNRQGGARGHSKPEDVMNLLMKLTRPDGYTADVGACFTLEFDKARGVHGGAIAPFTATLQPDGWKLEGVDEVHQTTRKLIDYLDLAHKAGERPKSATAAISQAKVQKAAGLKAWAELRKTGLRQHPEGGWWLG